MLIRQHEGRPCRHCGARNPGEESTCIARPTPENTLRPAAARRAFAFEDYDAISARIEELRRERDAARDVVPVAPEPQQDYGDCCG